MNLTRNPENRNVLDLDGEPTYKAATGIGQGILEEMLKYSKGKEYVVPPRMTYNVHGKCWMDDKGRICVFNLSQQPKAARYAREFLDSVSALRQTRRTDKNAIGGYATADNGEALSLDASAGEEKTTAIKLDSQVAETSARPRGKTKANP